MRIVRACESADTNERYPGVLDSASIVAGDGAAAVGLPTPDKLAHDPSVYRHQTHLEHEAFRQDLQPMRKGGPELTSNDAIKDKARIGCQVSVPGYVVEALVRGTRHLSQDRSLSPQLRRRSLTSSSLWPPEEGRRGDKQWEESEYPTATKPGMGHGRSQTNQNAQEEWGGGLCPGCPSSRGPSPQTVGTNSQETTKTK